MGVFRLPRAGEWTTGTWLARAFSAMLRRMDVLHYRRMKSPVGPLLLAISEKGLAILEFDRNPAAPASPQWRHARWIESEEETRLWAGQLEEYFSGRRREFNLPLDLRGTEFQLKCWHALLKIPYGQTRSYADIARIVGSPNGFRAVGQANHDNPIAIVVPCHRVLTSNGTLGGYGGGVATKEFLLRLEGARPPSLIPA